MLVQLYQYGVLGMTCPTPTEEYGKAGTLLANTVDGRSGPAPNGSMSCSLCLLIWLHKLTPLIASSFAHQQSGERPDDEEPLPRLFIRKLEKPTLKEARDSGTQCSTYK